MALIPEVKCRRCDKRYSGLRTRCPYCGMRRSGKGKRVPANDKTTLKMIIGLLLLLILAVAVVFLIVLSNKQNAGNNENKDTVYTSTDGGVSSETSNTTAAAADTTDTTTDTSETTAASAIASVKVNCYGSELSTSSDGNYNYEFSAAVGDTIPLTIEVTPADAAYTAVWASDDENTAVVLQTGDVTVVGSGKTGLTLTVGDKTVRILVRAG